MHIDKHASTEVHIGTPSNAASEALEVESSLAASQPSASSARAPSAATTEEPQRSLSYSPPAAAPQESDQAPAATLPQESEHAGQEAQAGHAGPGGLMGQTRQPSGQLAQGMEAAGRQASLTGLTSWASMQTSCPEEDDPAGGPASEHLL